MGTGTGQDPGPREGKGIRAGEGARSPVVVEQLGVGVGGPGAEQRDPGVS